MDARRIIATVRDGGTPSREELGWFAAGLARDAHNPTHSLDDAVISRLLGVRSGLPKTRGCCVDQPGIKLDQGIIP